MGYRNPLFAWRHAAREAGSSALSISTGSPASGTVARLIDNLSEGSKLLQITAASSVVAIDLDLGAGTLPTIDRALIPASHNLDTATLTVQQDDNAGFSTPTQLGQLVAPGAGLLEMPLSPDVSERYVQLRITVAPATVEIGELVYTERFEIDEGVKPAWTDQTISNVRVDELPVIDFTTELSEERREISLAWGRLSAANKALVDALVAGVGGRRDPFWVWTPDDLLPAAWARLTRDPRGPQGNPNPQVGGPQYDRELEMSSRLG